MEDGHKAEEVVETVTLRSVRTVMDVAARFVRLYDWSSQCREEGLCQREWGLRFRYLDAGLFVPKVTLCLKKIYARLLARQKRPTYSASLSAGIEKREQAASGMGRSS